MWLYRKIRRKIYEHLYVFYTPINRLFMNLNGVTVGRGLKTFGFVHVSNVDGMIILGDGITINSAGWANPIGSGYVTQLQVIGKGRITVGNHTGLSNCAITCAEEVTIGDNVLIGSGVKIFDTDFHPISGKDRLDRNLHAISTGPVNIGNNVFLGTGVIVLKGVKIGNNSVVGAGSVVTKDIGSNEVWGGNPARRIRDLEESNC